MFKPHPFSSGVQKKEFSDIYKPKDLLFDQEKVPWNKVLSGMKKKYIVEHVSDNENISKTLTKMLTDRRPNSRHSSINRRESDHLESFRSSSNPRGIIMRNFDKSEKFSKSRHRQSSRIENYSALGEHSNTRVPTPGKRSRKVADYCR